MKKLLTLVLLVTTLLVLTSCNKHEYLDVKEYTRVYMMEQDVLINYFYGVDGLDEDVMDEQLIYSEEYVEEELTIIFELGKENHFITMKDTTKEVVIYLKHGFAYVFVKERGVRERWKS